MVWGKPQLVHVNSIKSDITMLWLLELYIPIALDDRDK